MASKLTCIIIISFLILTSISTISAASRRGLSQDAAQDCVELSELMIDCLDFVMMPREMIEPLPSCCSSVSKVIQINPICICSSMEEAINMGLILNITAALELPTVCSIEVPPKARCSLLPPSPSPSPSSGSSQKVSAPVSSPPELKPVIVIKGGVSTLKPSVMVVITVGVIIVRSLSFF